MVNIQQDAMIINKQFPNIPIPKLVQFIAQLVQKYPNIDDQGVVQLLQGSFSALQKKKAQPFSGLMNQLQVGK